MASSVLVARAAIAAARDVQNGLSIEDAAKQFFVGRTSVVSAQLLLHYGTEWEIENVAEGRIGLHPTAIKIEKRLSREERKALFPNKPSKKVTDKRGELNSRILEAAKVSLDTGLVTEQAASDFGITRAAITYGRLFIEHATPEELEKARAGELGLQAYGTVIRARLTPEQRKALKSRNLGVRAHSALDKRHMESSIWLNLGASLANLAAMPDVSSVLDIVTRHRKRTDTTNTHITTAANWLKEFANAWQEFEAGHSNGNARNGSGNVGTEHTKPTS